MNSRAKGCRGEREWRDFLRAEGFLKARRSAQYCGQGPDASDVTCPELPGIHWEVKRTERFNLYESLQQAVHDMQAGKGLNGDYKIPVVAHKRNHWPWIVVLKAEDFMRIVRESNLVQKASSND